MSVTVIILCGGTSARMGGVDKTAMDLDGRSVLDRIVVDLPDDWPIVCVGEPRPLSRDVTWTREDPPLGGPVAGLAAGLAAGPDSDVIVTLAGDQPFAGPTAVACAESLRGAQIGPDVDGVAARQDDGHPQALLAAYRREPLARAVSAADPGSGVYRTLSRLEVLTLDSDTRATLDVDTPSDLDDARSTIRDADASG